MCIMQTSWVCTINMLVLSWIQVITIDTYCVESDFGVIHEAQAVL